MRSLNQSEVTEKLSEKLRERKIFKFSPTQIECFLTSVFNVLFANHIYIAVARSRYSIFVQLELFFARLLGSETCGLESLSLFRDPFSHRY